jgi:hypothetical protein
MYRFVRSGRAKDDTWTPQMVRSGAMTEIIDNLFVGDQRDAQSGFDGLIICVLGEKPLDEPPNVI